MRTDFYHNRLSQLDLNDKGGHYLLEFHTFFERSLLMEWLFRQSCNRPYCEHNSNIVDHSPMDNQHKIVVEQWLWNPKGNLSHFDGKWCILHSSMEPSRSS